MKLSRENTRALQIAFETYARQASTVMTSALRSPASFTLLGVEQQNYNEYVETLSDPTYLTVFSLEPLQQPAVLQMPLAATMTSVDRLLGGPGTPQQPERPLTELESVVVHGLYERLVTEVRYAFGSLVSVQPVVTGVEYSPQLAQVAAASDAMIVARFALAQGETEHEVTLAFSFNGLLPHLTSAGTGTITERERREREEAKARLAAGFQDVPVEVAVRFRGIAADPVELAGLVVGDLVRLRHPAEAPLDMTAADVVFAHATTGSHGQRLACLIVATPHQES
jgi:flagellar motor switch protein FliM